MLRMFAYYYHSIGASLTAPQFRLAERQLTTPHCDLHADSGQAISFIYSLSNCPPAC